MIIESNSIITVVMDTNRTAETVDLRTALVYDSDNKKIILSQTEPPISPTQFLNKTITLSILTHRKQGIVRQGLSAKIIEFIQDYPIALGQKVPAIVVIPNSQPREINFRSSYRVAPQRDCGLELSFSEYPFTLLDISIGGAAFSYSHDFPFSTGMPINLILTIDGIKHNVEALIKRIWFPEDHLKIAGLKFIAVEFSKISTEAARILGTKLIDIQRAIRANKID